MSDSRYLPALLTGMLLGAAVPAPAEPPGDYPAEIETWRARRVERLTAEDGWLTLVGLFWLEEGENTLGAEPESRVVFPAGKAPARVGVIRLQGGDARIELEPGVPVLAGGEPVRSLALRSDAEGEPTVLELGDLSFYLIERGGRLAVRMKDRNHPARAAFEGIDAYPTDPAWRTEGRFEPYEPVKKIPVPNVLGTVEEQSSPGAVAFEVGGATYRLDVLAESADRELFVIFADATTGRETYGGGRYLDADPPGPDGRVILDFNKAYNPPCVFTPFATCPLPPRQNRLPVRVEAGEKKYH